MWRCGIELYDDAFVQLRQTYKNACTRGIIHGSLHVNGRLMCPHAAPHRPRMVKVQCGGVGQALEWGTAEALALGAIRQPRRVLQKPLADLGLRMRTRPAEAPAPSTISVSTAFFFVIASARRRPFLSTDFWIVLEGNPNGSPLELLW